MRGLRAVGKPSWQLTRQGLSFLSIDSIKNIENAATVADGAFDSVVEKISGIVRLASEIDLAMHEQNEGGRQALEGLQEIESVTVQIRDGAVEMNEGAETILKEISSLSSVSQAVKERAASIAKATESIGVEVEKIVENTGTNKSAADVLIGITGRFKL